MPFSKKGGEIAPELERLVRETMERHGLEAATALRILEVVRAARPEERLGRIQAILEAEARADRA